MLRPRKVADSAELERRAMRPMSLTTEQTGLDGDRRRDRRVRLVLAVVFDGLES